MSTSKHTPGPWRVNRPLVERQRNGIIETPRGHIVLAWDSTASIGQEQHDANARLIALAPELFALAERVATNFEFTPLGDDAHELIRRARGEEPPR